MSEDAPMTGREMNACYLARKINVSYGRTLRKWINQARAYQPLVDRLCPHIAENDKAHCYAESDRLSVLAVRRG